MVGRPESELREHPGADPQSLPKFRCRMFVSKSRADENKAKLAAILTFHVLSGKVMAGDVAGKKLSPASVQGEELHVDGTAGVTVNGAKVVSADIACTNGVIHVIDTVILPKG